MKYTFKKPINETIAMMVNGTKEQLSDTWCDFLDVAEELLHLLKNVIMCLVFVLFIVIFPITAPVIQARNRKVTIDAWRKWFKFNPFRDGFEQRYRSLKFQIKKKKKKKK